MSEEDDKRLKKERKAMKKAKKEAERVEAEELERKALKKAKKKAKKEASSKEPVVEEAKEETKEERKIRRAAKKAAKAAAAAAETEEECEEKTKKKKNPLLKKKATKESEEEIPTKEPTLGYDKRHIVFVGQLHYLATKEDVRNHFVENGAGKDVKVRLLTDKRTGKSRGMAFLDMTTARNCVNALRCHHTKIRGRQINVERTVGGGGKGEKRKEKLKTLRDHQGESAQREVQQIVGTLVAENKLNKGDLDDRCIEALASLPRKASKMILQEFSAQDLTRISNKSLWCMGFIRRYRTALRDGKELVTKEEEMANVVENKLRSRIENHTEEYAVLGGERKRGKFGARN